LTALYDKSTAAAATTPAILPTGVGDEGREAVKHPNIEWAGVDVGGLDSANTVVWWIFIASDGDKGACFRSFRSSRGSRSANALEHLRFCEVTKLWSRAEPLECAIGVCDAPSSQCCDYVGTTHLSPCVVVIVLYVVGSSCVFVAQPKMKTRGGGAWLPMQVFWLILAQRMFIQRAQKFLQCYLCTYGFYIGGESPAYPLLVFSLVWTVGTPPDPGSVNRAKTARFLSSSNPDFTFHTSSNYIKLR
jgi:hypothetical protein